MTDISYHNHLPSPVSKSSNHRNACPGPSHALGTQRRARSSPALQVRGPVKILMQPSNCSVPGSGLCQGRQAPSLTAKTCLRRACRGSARAEMQTLASQLAFLSPLGGCANKLPPVATLPSWSHWG